MVDSLIMMWFSLLMDLSSGFSFQPVLHNWCNKYLVCEISHVKDPLLLIRSSLSVGGSRFLFLFTEWSLTICPIPYDIVISCFSQCSTTGVPKYVLSCLWDDAYKITLAANQKK